MRPLRNLTLTRMGTSLTASKVTPKSTINLSPIIPHCCYWQSQFLPGQLFWFQLSKMYGLFFRMFESRGFLYLCSMQVWVYFDAPIIVVSRSVEMRGGMLWSVMMETTRMEMDCDRLIRDARLILLIIALLSRWPNQNADRHSS